MDSDETLPDAIRRAGWAPQHEGTVPDDERMTAAEFRVIREFLGLTGDALAAILDVDPRTVRHWEAGKYHIPDGVRIHVEQLEEMTARAVADGAAQLADVSEPGVFTYRTDADYLRAVPTTVMPASWHRAVVARIALEVPGLAIDYPRA
jgi:DNA-binding transcriptional regulator YiaG